mmetsp:Transcript_4612/g.11156  ORF Transcript_4612/g.11156 Transcript_4612/m.11156 type:complete len:241 (-) Transcript_4612:284-1006(-)
MQPPKSRYSGPSGVSSLSSLKNLSSFRRRTAKMRLKRRFLRHHNWPLMKSCCSKSSCRPNFSPEMLSPNSRASCTFSFMVCLLAKTDTTSWHAKGARLRAKSYTLLSSASNSHKTSDSSSPKNSSKFSSEKLLMLLSKNTQGQSKSWPNISRNNAFISLALISFDCFFIARCFRASLVYSHRVKPIITLRRNSSPKMSLNRNNMDFRWLFSFGSIPLKSIRNTCTCFTRSLRKPTIPSTC